MQHLYDSWEAAFAARVHPNVILTAMQALRSQRSDSTLNGFDRIATCRRALDALDKQVRLISLT